MKAELNIDWKAELADTNVEEQWDIIKSKIKLAEQHNIPKFNKNKKKWQKLGSISLNSEVTKEIKRKHRLCTRYIETKDEAQFQEYKIQRNKVNKFEKCRQRKRKGDRTRLKKEP